MSIGIASQKMSTNPKSDQFEVAIVLGVVANPTRLLTVSKTEKKRWRNVYPMTKSSPEPASMPSCKNNMSISY